MKYRVFLSSRGEDTTHTSHTFTAQLHKTLKDIGIHVFFDEVTLDKGEPLSQQRFPAIADSDISIIILSKDYASSKSCLNELSHIMDCKDRQGQIVLPIFYHVAPSVVRHLGGSFKTSFEENESERPFDEVKRWKSAFADFGTLKGWHIKGDRSETEYIEDVAKKVIEILNSKSRSVSEGVVGIDDQKKTILRLIENEENRVIGLWGMGGCGKTTLAEAVYNEISSKFDAHSFVRNVREKCEKEGMESVRNDLVSKLLNSVTSIDTPSISTSIQQRLENKKVIVVLDDVRDSDQIFGMGIKQFGRGSKIIVTSRDQQELKNGGADKIHKVEMLSENDSLRLFSTHAFKKLNPPVEFLSLSYKFLKYAKGSPLALKVLGSILYTKPREVWESEVVKLNECAKLNISQVQKRCFDGLDELEKKIFLDIAILFKGKPKEQVEAYLRGCYDESAVSALSRLLDKCLIEIVTIYSGYYDELPYEVISMHDMLEEMGKSIERKDSGNRKRLWKDEDVYEMLRNNKWAHSVEGVMLKASEFNHRWLRSDVFQNMHSLRLIYLYGYSKKQPEVEVDIEFPDELKYLHWEYYPFKSLPSSFNPTNLIVLRLSGHLIEHLWNEDHEDLVNLRDFDVSGCTNLRKIPNLSGAYNLKKINCYGCESLVELPSLGHLVSLEEVDLTSCTSLMKIPNLSGALNLKKINCSECKNLVELPSLDHLTSLEEMDLTFCTSLKKIPNLSGALNLKKINCSECKNLVELPSLDHLVSLEEVDLIFCTKLRKIPNLSGAVNLKTIDCYGCESLVELPSLDHLVSLEEVNFLFCTSLTKIPNLSGALNLKRINCSGCKSLVELPSLDHLPSLEEVDITFCTSLTKIPNLYDGRPYEVISMHDMLEEMDKSIECKDSGNRKRLQKDKDVSEMLRNNKSADSVEGITLDVSKDYASSKSCLDELSDKSRSVLEGLDGIGGSGKTTLAEAVYNESNKAGVSWSIEQDQDEIRTKPSSSKDGNSLLGMPSDLHDLRIESSGIDDNQTVSPHASPSKVHKDQDETRTRPSSSEDENHHFSSSMEMPVDLHSLKIEIRESVDDQIVSPHAFPSIAHQDQDETGTRPSSSEDGNQHFSSSLEMPSDLHSLRIERRESDDDQTVSPQVSPSIVHKDQDDTQTRPSSREDGNHQFSSSTKMPSDLDTLRIERYAYCMLPKEILECFSLQHLYLIDCILLKSFPLSPSLKTLYIHNCKSLEFSPPNKLMNQLEDLCLGSSCDSLKIFPLSSFPKLKSLSLRDCRNLEYLSVDKKFHNQLTSLEALEIKDCPKLRCFLEGEVTSSKLISLVFFNCVSLKSLQPVQRFKSLQSLHLNKCSALESFPNEGLPSGLIILCISFCDKIIPTKGWNLDKLHSLSHFEIEGGCQTMKSFPEEGLLPTNLNSLRISGLLNLTSLDSEGLQKLTSLRTLEINSCNTLHSLPERMPSSLYSLSITNCSLLNTKLRNRKEKEWSKIADIASIFLDEDSD